MGSANFPSERSCLEAKRAILKDTLDYVKNTKEQARSLGNVNLNIISLECHGEKGAKQ